MYDYVSFWPLHFWHLAQMLAYWAPRLLKRMILYLKPKRQLAFLTILQKEKLCNCIWPNKVKDWAWRLNGNINLQVWGTEEMGLGLKFCHLRRTLDSACDTGGVVALNLQLLLFHFYPHLKWRVPSVLEEPAKKEPKTTHRYRTRTFIPTLQFGNFFVAVISYQTATDRENVSVFTI